MSYFVSAFREANRAVLHKFGALLGSILTVFLATLMAGSFALIIKNTSIALEKFKTEATVEVYIAESADSAVVENLRDRLVANTHILNVKLISKEAALYRLREMFGHEMVAGLKTNPLPKSFEITLDPEVYEQETFEAMVDSLDRLPGVEDIGYVPKAISRLRLWFKLLAVVGAVMGFLVALATGFIVGNTIHVKIADRSQTYYVMRLVGASTSFIRMPYLLIGSLIGFVGCALSLSFLKFSQVYFSRFVVAIEFLSPLESVCFIIAGGLLGLTGSHLALKRSLKI
ncbi:MAG: hypothetical protein GY839_05110 [candidate division Zixibacteria bacterium]|nr:hypothetical protein [candidate division Zixibacteria bacterium]